MQRKHVENGCVPVLRTVAHLFTLALRIYIYSSQRLSSLFTEMLLCKKQTIFYTCAKK